MARSICSKCERSNFEMVEQGNVRGAKYKIMFIQCSHCGSVVGTTDYYNVPSLLEKVAKRMGFNLYS